MKRLGEYLLDKKEAWEMKERNGVPYLNATGSNLRRGASREGDGQIDKPLLVSQGGRKKRRKKEVVGEKWSRRCRFGSASEKLKVDQNKKLREECPCILSNIQKGGEKR